MQRILQGTAGFREPQVQDAKLRLEEHKEHFESLGLDVKAKVDVIKEGDISQSIMETADKENVSLIVMNSYGKSLIKGLLLGSVHLSVLRHAKKRCFANAL